MARPWAFPDGEIGPRPSTPIHAIHTHITSHPRPFAVPPPNAKGVVPYSPGLRRRGATPGPGHIAFPTPQGVVPFVPAGGVRETRAEWDRVRGCRRGVPPKCMSTLHAIHTHHMPPVRTIGTTPLGREWCVWVGVDRFVAMDGGQRRWRCSAIVAHTRGNAGLWGRTLSAFPEGEEGPIHPEIHRIIPQHPTRGRRA